MRSWWLVVRCVGCGAVVSEWAAYCLVCRASLDEAKLLEPEGPAGEQEVDPLGVAAHDRSVGAAEDAGALDATGEVGGPTSGHDVVAARSVWQNVFRVRPVAAALAVAVALSVGIVVALRSTGAPPQRANGTLTAVRSLSVVFTGPTGARLVPLNNGRPVQLSKVGAGTPISVGGDVVFLQAHAAMVLDAATGSHLQYLSMGDSLFPMVWPNTVGVASTTGTGETAASYEDLSGGPSAAGSWVMPRGYMPATQFVAFGPGRVLTRWSPLDRSVQLGSRIGPAKTVIGQTSDSVAWSRADCASNSECPLVISPSDPATPGGGSGSAVPPPPGHHGYLPAGAVSPDGQYLATFIAAGDHSASLVVIDMAGYHVTDVPGSKVPVGSTLPSAHWSPEGNVVIFSGSGGSMHAWATGELSAATLPLPASSSFAVTG
jgi:hypothetical protein